ncbi:MAG: hypothetical protein GY906_31635 [bacterium]|nr:hypothetical protein [bacterium]
MASLQVRVTKGFNRRHNQLGPLWQSRYRAKLLEHDYDLVRLISYIHLNPVSAGMAEDPADYSWSGHSELVRRTKDPLIDVDETLLVFGARRPTAKRAYLRALRAKMDDPWMRKGPGHLPWWSGAQEDDAEVTRDLDGPFLDHLGRSTEPERPVLDVETFLERAAKAVGFAVSDLAARKKVPEIAEARGLIVLLGLEWYRQKVKEISCVLKKHPGSLSLAASRFADRRAEDSELQGRFEEVDAAIRGDGGNKSYAQ